MAVQTLSMVKPLWFRLLLPLNRRQGVQKAPGAVRNSQ